MLGECRTANLYPKQAKATDKYNILHSKIFISLSAAKGFCETVGSHTTPFQLISC
jgi:hypothetical protein